MPLGARMLRRLLVAAATLLCGVCAAATLTVNVGNITEARGNVRIAVYDRETWLDTERWVAAQRIPAETGPDVAATFELPHGTYAIAVLHDVNGNEKMDYGLLRLPKEPYGFSNGVVPRLGPPAFDDAAFVIADEDLSIAIELRN